jgi:alkaline phosphatase
MDGLWGGFLRLFRRRVALAACLALATAVLVGGSALFPSRGDAQQASGGARNVILVVGDGLGPAHRDAIQLATVGPYERLAMDSLPYAGMAGTNSVESDDPPTFVTDSAAAATSLASGIKTFNGAIGVDPDGRTVPTVLERARTAGKATGVVTTSQVTDATPAAFGAHVEDRDEQAEIARQFVEESRPDVILGGGEDWWYPEGDEGAFPDKQSGDDEEVSQSNRGNLVERARQEGYEYVTSAGELSSASGPRILGLFANEEMFQQASEGDGDEYDPVVPLPEMTSKALDTLSADPDGFFLLVEEEGVDEMSHYNNAERMLQAGEQMDRTVALLEDFAEGSGDTLLITTGDHECGGLTVEAVDDPEFPDESGGNQGDENANLSTEDGPFDIVGSDYELVADWSTTGHTGVDVPTTALGPGAASLTGNYENTHIHDVMVESLGLAGVGPATTSASASAVPDTGGAGPGAVLGAAALLAGASLLIGGRLAFR